VSDHYWACPADIPAGDEVKVAIPAGYAAPGWTPSGLDAEGRQIVSRTIMLGDRGITFTFRPLQ
jgi:hypothetical protein